MHRLRVPRPEPGRRRAAPAQHAPHRRRQPARRRRRPLRHRQPGHGHQTRQEEDE